MASGIYNIFKGSLLSGGVDCLADTLKVILLSGGHSFTATNTTYSAISANEVVGTGYSSGGATLGSKTVTTAATSYLDAADSTWSSSTFTAAHAAIYDSSVGNTLLCSFDFGGNQTVSSGTFTVSWNNTSGIISLT